MADVITAEEYLQIEAELNASQDYREFIIKYFENNHVDVQYLRIKAHWLMIVSEPDQSLYSMNLNQFIHAYKDLEDERIRLLVIDAWLLKLQRKVSVLSLGYLNEKINVLFEYCATVNERHLSVKKALVFIYWYKGQNALDRDWRKAQYFYNKVITLSREISDAKHDLYIIQAQCAKIVLHLQYGHTEHIEQLLYAYFDLYKSINNELNHLLINQLIQLYVDYLVTECQWFTPHPKKINFLKYINDNVMIQQMILDYDDVTSEPFTILLLAQQFWLEDNELFNQFIDKLLSWIENKEQLLELIADELIFESQAMSKQFLLMVEESYDRYTSLNKYRRMFNQKYNV